MPTKLKRLHKFEQRMLNLKGIKLPSVGVKDTTYSSNGRKPNVKYNRLSGSILADINEDYVRDEALDDIIVGVCRTFDETGSHKGSKLNKAVVRSMLHKLPNISSQSVHDNYGYAKKQSELYAHACRLVIMFKNRHDLKQLRKYTDA